ncbi:MAG: class I SAM-dependent methyltransferase [Desulfotalea sp.]
MLTASSHFRKVIKDKTTLLSRHEMIQWRHILTNIDRDANILEVGSGKGGKTNFLHSQGFKNILSVEKNTHHVKEGKQRGINIVSVDEFNQKYENQRFDFLVLSHIIEHFQFEDVVKFIDGYLKFVKPDGLILIATPMAHPHFWTDLDHQKPYYPQGIKNFYNGKSEQVSFVSPYKMGLKDIRFRKSPFKIKNNRNLLLKKNDLPLLIFNFLCASLFKLTRSLIGYKTGWIGLYKLQDDTNHKLIENEK